MTTEPEDFENETPDYIEIRRFVFAAHDDDPDGKETTMNAVISSLPHISDELLIIHARTLLDLGMPGAEELIGENEQETLVREEAEPILARLLRDLDALANAQQEEESSEEDR